MWGSSIIGFGAYHYRYPSGREGYSALASFSPHGRFRIARRRYPAMTGNATPAVFRERYGPKPLLRTLRSETRDCQRLRLTLVWCQGMPGSPPRGSRSVLALGPGPAAGPRAAIPTRHGPRRPAAPTAMSPRAGSGPRT
jgi:hypothetical protein